MKSKYRNFWMAIFILAIFSKIFIACGNNDVNKRIHEMGVYTYESHTRDKQDDGSDKIVLKFRNGKKEATLDYYSNENIFLPDSRFYDLSSVSLPKDLFLWASDCRFRKFGKEEIFYFVFTDEDSRDVYTCAISVNKIKESLLIKTTDLLQQPEITEIK